MPARQATTLAQRRELLRLAEIDQFRFAIRQDVLYNDIVDGYIDLLAGNCEGENSINPQMKRE